MLITVQSFEAIGRRSSDILCLVKKTSRLKQKAFGTNVPGGLINCQHINTVNISKITEIVKLSSIAPALQINYLHLLLTP